MDTVDIYFDFRSPYTYFAAHLIARSDVALPPGVVWRWRPVSINVLLNLQAARAPTASYADPLAPVKRRYVFKDIGHCGDHYAIPYLIPDPLRPDTIPAMVVFERSEANPDAQRRFLTDVFEAVWLHQKDVGDRATLAKIAAGADIDDALVGQAFLQDSRDRFVARSVNAYESAGVFGVPTFVWNAERFFGVDRLAMVCAAVTRKRQAA